MARQLMELHVHPKLLKRRLTELGLSGNELARRIDIGQATISRLVSGSHNVVTKRVAQAVEQELQVKSGDYFVAAAASRVPPKCKGCGTECATCGSAAA